MSTQSYEHLVLTHSKNKIFGQFILPKKKKGFRDLIMRRWNISFLWGSRIIQCVVPEKIHTRPMEGHWKFLGGGGVLRVKFLEVMYENKPEFPGGRGMQNKNLPWGYFLEQYNLVVSGQGSIYIHIN